MSRFHPYCRTGRWRAFAHQGDVVGRPPGNNPGAFESAVELGYTHIETDVRRTADGEVVLFHDDTLDRTTDGTGPVGERSWAELTEVRFRVGDRVLDERILRVEEGLRRWPGVFWNLDAKDPAALGPLLEVIEREGATDRVLVSAFSPWTTLRLRFAAPDGLGQGLSMLGVAVVRVAAWLRLPVPRLGDAVQVPETWKGVRVLDERLVRACQRRGMAVHVWTVNDRADMERFLDLGVDGIMTDDAALLKEVLESRDLW